MICKKWKGVPFLHGTVLTAGARIALLGAGKMGTVIAETIIRNNVVRASDLSVTGRSKKENLALLESLGAKACETNMRAVENSDIVLLCNKKDDVGALLSEIGGDLAGRTVIYIAAGLPVPFVEERALHAGVVAAMPNIGLEINYSHTGLSAGKSASERDKRLAEGIFAAMGSIEWIEERLRTAFTAACACTPAIGASIIRHLAAPFEQLGISKEDSIRWVAKGFAATALILNGSEMSAEEIESKVATKGGLTEAGLKKAESLGLSGIMAEIVGTMVSRGKHMEKPG